MIGKIENVNIYDTINDIGKTFKRQTKRTPFKYILIRRKIK